jgi:hypothetical protein
MEKYDRMRARVVLNDCLNNRVHIELTGNCSSCEKNIDYKLPNYTHAELASQHNDVIFDVGLYMNFTFVFGFIMQLNATAIRYAVQHVRVPWVEVEAAETLESLQTNPAKLFITYTLCNICRSNRTDTCIRYCSNCRTYDNCSQLHTLAKSLGCFKPTSLYPTEAHRLVDIAHRGCYTATVEQWQTKDYLRTTDWHVFLNLKCCLRCHVPWKTAWFKPYCSTCSHTVQCIEFSNPGPEISVDEVVKLKLRQKLSWLSRLPACTLSSVTCSICKSKNMSYTHWFGVYRSCCAKCLYERCVADGLLTT